MPRILHGSFDERALRIRVYDERITPLGDYAHIWRVPISVRSTTTMLCSWSDARMDGG